MQIVRTRGPAAVADDGTVVCRGLGCGLFGPWSRLD